MRALAALEGRARAIDRWTALLAAIGALGAALVLLRTAPWGPEVSSDAVWYVSSARNLLAGDGLVSHNGVPYFLSAMPGLSLTLAFVGLFGPDPLDAVRWLHAAAFGGTVFVTAWWVRSRTGSRFLAVWAGLACALSPLGGLFSAALTEPTFVLYAALSLFALDRYLAGRRRSLLLAAALCAALACATRYMGVALVASAIPLLLLAERRGVRPSARGIAHAAIFAAVALAPPGARMLHNLLTIGSPAEPIKANKISTLADLHMAAVEFARWTLGEGGFSILGAWLGAGQLSIGVVLGLAAAPLALLAGAVAALALSRGDPGRRAGLAVPALFLACYAPMLAVALTPSDAALVSRYLAPMYPPLLAAAAIVLGGLLRRASRRGPYAALPRPFGGARAALPALALAAVLAIWLPQQAVATWEDVRDWRADGRGYTSRDWAESATIRYLQAHPPEGLVWSNKEYAVYILAEVTRTGNRALPTGLPGAARVAAGSRAGGADDRFVWFHRRSPQQYDPADLAALPDLEVEAVLEDGVVFRPGAGPPRGGTPLADRLLEGARLLAPSPFALHLDEARNRLVYVRDGCAGGDTAAPFFLEAYPADPAALPAGQRSGRLDFGFRRYGFREAGRCLAVRDLPGFAVAAVLTGQRAPDWAERWSARVPLAAAPAAAALDIKALASRAERLAGEPFEVYLDGGRLVYAREGCVEADVATRFFLHVVPRDPADLPANRRESGFANLDFWFRDGDYGYEAGGRCVTARELPRYPIASIRTWQAGEGGAPAWEAGAVLARTAAAEAAAAIDLGALRARAEPLGAGAFEVWRDGDRLVYVREGCAEADAAAAFFLHVTPSDPGDLPEDRRGSGFANLDFRFEETGAIEGGRCVAARGLPAYPIASIRTGQWARGEGELWAAEASFGE